MTEEEGATETSTRSTRQQAQAVLLPGRTWDYEVKSGKTGLGLYAARDIKKNRLVFEESLEFGFSHVRDGDYLLLSDMKGGGDRFPLTNDVLVRTHGVPRLIPDPTGETGGTVYWRLESPQMLMNHSCDPNCVSESKDFDHGDDLASRPIKRGEELTCNYILDYYDIGPFFGECLCGAENCRGSMMGFKSLSEEEKERYFPQASDAVQAMHLADSGRGPPVVYRPPEPPSPRPFSSFPSSVDHAVVPRLVFPGPSCYGANIAVRSTSDEEADELVLYALRDFKFGEKVYDFWRQPWPLLNDAGKPAVIDMIFAKSMSAGDPPEGTVARFDPLKRGARRDRKGVVQFTGCDMLAQHSCEPNLAYTDWHMDEDEEDNWRGAYAVRDISAGERLTVDYNCFLWDLTENGAMKVETCSCGSEGCTGVKAGFKHLAPEAREERRVMSWKRDAPPFEEDAKYYPMEALDPHVRMCWRKEMMELDDTLSLASTSSSSSCSSSSSSSSSSSEEI